MYWFCLCVMKEFVKIFSFEENSSSATIWYFYSVKEMKAKKQPQKLMACLLNCQLPAWLWFGPRQIVLLKKTAKHGSLHSVQLSNTTKVFAPLNDLTHPGIKPESMQCMTSASHHYHSGELPILPLFYFGYSEEK